MFYVTRSPQGTIRSISEQEDATHKEAIATDHPDVHAFLQRYQCTSDELSALTESDMGVIRVLDDVIDLLIKKDLLQFTELPAAAQSKLLKRRSMRESLPNLSTSSTLIETAEDDGEALI